VENIKAHIVINDIKDAGKWGRKITSQVDAISPQYPTTNIELADEVWDGGVKIGTGYTVILEASTLKRPDADPDKTWSYWWRIIDWNVNADEENTNIWDEPSPAKYNLNSGSPGPVNTNNFFDATAGQRYNQHGLNVRTALMQAREIMTENGAFISKDMEETFAISDEILKYLNSRVFVNSPLVTKAINEGAVPVEIKDIPDDPILADSWIVPEKVLNGVDLKTALQNNGLDMEWVLSNAFKVLGIAKSVDYVSAERGSYRDLLIEVLLDAQKQGIEKSDSQEI